MAVKKKTESESLELVADQLKNAGMPLQIKSVIRHDSSDVNLIIDLDPGGGFEGGFEITALSAPIPLQFTSLKTSLSSKNQFRFAMHDEGMMDRVGKIFGLEDVEIGYKEFDKQLIIKTNDAPRVKQLFKDLSTRKVFQGLKDFSLQITEDEEKKNGVLLELMIDRAVIDHKEVVKLYEAYVEVLDQLNSQE